MAMISTVSRLVLVAAALCTAAPLAGQGDPRVRPTAEGVTIDFVNADLAGVVQALTAYMDRPVLFSGLPSTAVTLQYPRPVPASDLPGVLRSLLESQGLDLVEAGPTYQIRQRGQPGGVHAPPPQAQQQAAMGAGGMQLNVIRLRHARAADVAATVNALYGRGSALGEIGARTPTLNEQFREQRIPPAGMQGPAQPSGFASGNLSGELSMVPDPRSNSLLIRSTQADFVLIRAAVDQLDVRPLQVIIEALVAEVRRDHTFEWGLGGRLPPSRVRGTSTVVDADLATPRPSDLLIRAWNVTGLNLDLELSAGVARGQVTILSRPLVIAANNEEAEVNVGTQRPFVQVQRSSDGGVFDQIVQYKDVGTTLRILPTISADGDVMLRVTQEVNSATGETGIRDAPVISTRSIQTQLLIRDGETVVLGGLVDTQRERASGGIPVLSSIPVVGAFFGRRSRRSTDTELFVFLTPRVIYAEGDLENATNDVRQNTRYIRRAVKRTLPHVLPRPGKQAPEEAEDTAPVVPGG